MGKTGQPVKESNNRQDRKTKKGEQGQPGEDSQENKSGSESLRQDSHESTGMTARTTHSGSDCQDGRGQDRLSGQDTLSSQDSRERTARADSQKRTLGQPE
jgi:hypothetical protein